MMRTAIMQPYFFAYIGYYQLIHAADKFVVYDNIQFTKKGWINRNRILVDGKDKYISLSIKQDSDYLDVRDRYLADDFVNSNKKIIRRIESAYRNAPFFKTTFPLIEECLNYEDGNLFNFLLNAIIKTCRFLKIDTPIVVSSTLALEDNSLKGADKVIAICKSLGANQYINLPGGRELYNSDEFGNNGIRLEFLVPQNAVYQQGWGGFLPCLSIIDVLMFNSAEQVQELIEKYQIE